METNERTVVPECEPISSVKKNDAIKKKIKIPKLMLRAKIIITVLLALVLSVGIFSVFHTNNSKLLSTVSKSSLQKVIEINELSTIDYTYNAIATKYDENQNEQYYVAYEGKVTAGIDFNEIQIEVIEDEKKVKITIPEVEIHSTKVDMGTMEYIFTKNKYETEDISQEAYKLCKNDLKTRIDKENVLYDTARENAISSVKAIFKPWIDTIDNAYTVEVE